MGKTIAVIGALDTKGHDYAFIKQEIEKHGHQAFVIDTGVLGEPFFDPDISAEKVAEAGGSSLEELRKKADKSHAMSVMTRGIAVIMKELFLEGKIDAGFSIGRIQRDHDRYIRLASPSGGSPEGDGEHGGLRRYKALCGDQRYCHDSVDIGCGRSQPDQRQNLFQCRRCHCRHVGSRGAAHRYQTFDHRLHVWKHHHAGESMQTFAGTKRL